MHESGPAVRPVLRHYEETKLRGLISVSVVLLAGIWPLTRNEDFWLTGLWLTLTLVAVVGYFRSSFVRQLEEHLWR